MPHCGRIRLINRVVRHSVLYTPVQMAMLRFQAHWQYRRPNWQEDVTKAHKRAAQLCSRQLKVLHRFPTCCKLQDEALWDSHQQSNPASTLKRLLYTHCPSQRFRLGVGNSTQRAQLNSVPKQRLMMASHV
jgi:hypothetical protein